MVEVGGVYWGGWVGEPAEGGGVPGGTVGPAPPNPHDFLLPRPPSPAWPPLTMSLPTHTCPHHVQMAVCQDEAETRKEGSKVYSAHGLQNRQPCHELDRTLSGLTAAVAAGDVTGMFQAGLWVERTSVRDPLKKRGGWAI